MKNSTLTDAIVNVMTTNADTEYNAKGMTLELKKRKIDAKVDTVKRIMIRLHKEGIIEKAKRGFYRAKSTTKEDFDLIRESGIEDTIKLETKPVPKLHKIFLTFNAKTIFETLEKAELIKNVKWDKGEGRVSNNDYPINIELLQSLTDIFSQDNLYQRYVKTHTTQSIKDGYQDVFTFTTSKYRTIKIQTYGTGSVNVIIACDKDPLSPSELIVVFLALDMIFQSKYGYSFLNDLIDFFILSGIEFNRDEKKVEYIPKGEVVTVRMLEDWAFRYYTKEIEGETVIREEYIFQGGKRPPTASQFIASLESAIQGGVNVQYLIYNTKQLFDANRLLQQQVEQLSNATQYNLAENRRILRVVEDLAKELKELKGGIP